MYLDVIVGNEVTATVQDLLTWATRDLAGISIVVVSSEFTL